MTKAMQEEEMNTVHELDGCDEAEGQRLLATAFETVPVGEVLAGELLRRVRRQDKTRRRVRTLVPAGAVAVAAVAVTLTATVAAAPPASAAVKAAAAKTSAESFHVTMEQSTVVGSSSGARSSARMAGDFDPSRGLGEETASRGPVSQVRYLGEHVYARISKTDPLGHGKPWVESLNVGLPYDPGTFLAQLEKEGTATGEGPASGPGWTGRKYAFTVRAVKNGPVTNSGTVYVDNQGLVRRLVMTTTLLPVPGEPWEQLTDDVTFGDFGVSVPVAAPPASQVYNPGHLFLGYFPL
jgi:hypothetical protein